MRHTTIELGLVDKGIVIGGSNKGGATEVWIYTKQGPDFVWAVSHNVQDDVGL